MPPVQEFAGLSQAKQVCGEDSRGNSCRINGDTVNKNGVRLQCRDPNRQEVLPHAILYPVLQVILSIDKDIFSVDRFVGCASYPGLKNVWCQPGGAENRATQSAGLANPETAFCVR